MFSTRKLPEKPTLASAFVLSALILSGQQAEAQLTDQTQTPNAAGEGIALSLEEQIGAGQGDIFTPDSSAYIIRRDPARAMRRGRQLFQRKFRVAQGMGPRIGGGLGDIAANPGLGAGLADSCAAGPAVRPVSVVMS